MENYALRETPVAAGSNDSNNPNSADGAGNMGSANVLAEYPPLLQELLSARGIVNRDAAHKFLNPQAARQTIFGVIAREMRKYYVSLLVVDQRPSGIDQEIISQIGTKIVAQLNDEKDIQAVLTGVNGAQALRSILASLDTKKQALLLGHAIAMPVVVQTREYDEKFYRAMGDMITTQQIDQFFTELF